jgi:hypothetical protein
LSEAAVTPDTRQDLVARYEQLRRDAIGPRAHGGEGLGFALFLRRGMTAWMQAWPECAGNVDPGTRAQPDVDETIPGDMRSQIATLLACMILGLQQEVAS